MNLSHNKLVEVEPDFGKLFVLSTLNLQGNLIERVSPNLGMCVRLKSLNLAANRICEIPRELGNCTLLEEIYLQNNYIRTMPGTVGTIIALRILDLRNNKLQCLPYELARIPTITEIRCSDNNELTMIPAEMREDSELVIWALKLHRDQIDSVGAKTTIYDGLFDQCRESEEMRLRLRDEVTLLQKDIKELEDTRPARYIALKENGLAKVKKKCVIM